MGAREKTTRARPEKVVGAFAGLLADLLLLSCVARAPRGAADWPGLRVTSQTDMYHQNQKNAKCVKDSNENGDPLTVLST